MPLDRYWGLRPDVHPLWVKLTLTPLSWIFSAVVGIRNWCFDNGFLPQKNIEGKVISVGNLAVGGTGKTPVVHYLASILIGRGYRPAILSRGYKSGLSNKGTAIYLGGELVRSRCAEPALQPDEPRMLSAKLAEVPVVLGAERSRSAEFLRASFPEYNVTHWLLDDGFQHRYLNRSVDIVLCDAQTHFGNGYMLPRGKLREPVSSLERASAVIFTRAGPAYPNPEVLSLVEAHLGTGGLLLSAVFKNLAPVHVEGEPKLRYLASGPVGLVCAIADPQRMKDSLVAAGFDLHGVISKKDHESITAEDLSKIADGLPVITTEKDYWRDQAAFAASGLSVYVLPISVELNRADDAKLVELII